jgi:signal transduction histidine kinase
MLKRLTSYVSSFRAQTVLLMAALLLANTVALQFINQRLERRVTEQAEGQFNELAEAVDLALRSFWSGEYISDLVNDAGLSVTPASTVRHILITDGEGKVIDSAHSADRDQPLKAEIADLPTVSQGQAMAGLTDQDHPSKIVFPVRTSEGERVIIVVVSLGRLAQTAREAARVRLLATLFTGLLLVALIAWVSRRFTRPVTKLAQAAQRVKAGNLDFRVHSAQQNEVGALVRTFDEMVAGLRRNRELEEQLQRAERSAVVGRLASGIAHEIRNPLNFMNLSIDHLREKLTAPPASEQAAEAARAEAVGILGLIKDEVGRLNRLVSDFLSYGRPAKLKLREVDLRALLEEVLGLVRAQAEQQGVSVSLAVEESDTPRGRDTTTVVGVEQIKTCFSNLVINAVQAMPDGGELKVTLAPEELHLKITIADTGHGIAPEAMRQIFEPYFSTKETGIGLGLPLTKKLIEDHGGEITVASEVGRGTTFTVLLPREAIERSGTFLVPPAGATKREKTEER